MKAIFQNEEIGGPVYDGFTFGGYALTTPLVKADYPGLRAIRLEDGTVILAEDLPDSYVIPPGGGGSGGPHTHDWSDVTGEPSTFPPTSHDTDHDDRFSLLAHAHAGVYAPVEHDTTHDDRFSLLAHTHAAHADTDHDDRFALIEHDSAHSDVFSALAHTHAAHADTDHDDRFSILGHSHAAGEIGGGFLLQAPLYFTASDTFVKADHPGLTGLWVEVVGGGGGGGGAATTGAGVAAAGGGGGGGAYRKAFVILSQLAASAAITVGTGGTGGATGSNNGSPGGTSSLTLSAGAITAAGGAGGTASGTAVASGTVAGGAGGSPGTTGLLNLEISGGDGGPGVWRNAGADIWSFGVGGGTQYGQVNRNPGSNSGTAGLDGKAYGGGGNGGYNYPSQATARAGGNGAPGLVIIHRLYGEEL